MNWIALLKEIVIELLGRGPQHDPPAEPMPTQPTTPNPDTLLPTWDDQKSAYHNTRVLCDLSGLTLEEKNLICACIFQESRFLNTATCYNKNKQGVITSVDVGLVQVNSYYHCGVGKDFPSTTYVINNPQKAVQWMINCYQDGLLKMWVSYSSGAYKQWLEPNSPMWHL